MKLKKFLLGALAIVLIVALTIAGTVAFLTTEKQTKKNVFTVGDVEILLSEKVGVIGGGEVSESSDGATYTEIVPGDYIQKEVNVANTGDSDAYVKVVVTLNNALALNKAIDDVYEKAPYNYSEEAVQAMYDYIFDGWGLNYTKVGDNGEALGMRLTITGDDMPEHVLQVDSVKTISEYWQQASTNWYKDTDTVIPYDGYYTTGMSDYQIRWVYYIKLAEGEDTTLFKGFNVPEEFDAKQLAMFDGLEINVEASAIQADNFDTAKEAFDALAAIEAGDKSFGEPDFENGVVVDDDAALADAIKKSDVKKVFVSGDLTYDWGGNSYASSEAPNGKTIEGLGDASITFKGYGSANDVTNVTLKNITVKDETVGDNEASWEHGYLEFNGVTATNVTFADGIMLNGDCVLTNCTFDNQISSWYALWVEGGNVVIDNCTFTGTRAVKIHEAYESDVASVVVKNSSFTLSEKPGVVIGDLDATTVVTIEGNVFDCQEGDQKKFIYESDTDVATFKFTEKNNKVVEHAADQEALNAALDAGKEIVYLSAGEYTFPTSKLAADTTLICEEGTVFTGNSKLNIKGATVIGATFSNPGGTAVDQTINGTFKDCTFTGKNGLRWCYAGETVVFENCVFDGSTYGVHFDGGANDVLFKNCTLSGFNAMGGEVTKLTMEGCTFKANGKSAYNGINLWGSTDMIDCTFIFDGTATEWVDAMGDNNTYTFTGCVVSDGTTERALTATDVGDYGAGNTITVK